MGDDSPLGLRQATLRAIRGLPDESDLPGSGAVVEGGRAWRVACTATTGRAGRHTCSTSHTHPSIPITVGDVPIRHLTSDKVLIAWHGCASVKMLT